MEGYDFFLPKQYARTLIDSPYGDGGVRIFRDSPESVCVQVRTLGPLTSSRNGKRRAAFSGVSLTHSELTQVINELTKQRDKLAVQR